MIIKLTKKDNSKILINSNIIKVIYVHTNGNTIVEVSGRGQFGADIEVLEQLETIEVLLKEVK